MLHFLQSLFHDFIVPVALTLLALLWGLGVRWAWRFLANGVLKHPALRAPAALLFWWVFWLVARFAVVQAVLLAVGAAMLMHPGPVMAGDLLARQGDDSVRFTDQPCPITDAILDHVPQGARGYLRLARAHFQGQDYTACWAPAGDKAWLWYEDGDQGVIPMRELKDAPEV